MNTALWLQGVRQYITQTVRTDATTDFSRAFQRDASIIGVPTPLSHHRDPDLTRKAREFGITRRRPWGVDSTGYAQKPLRPSIHDQALVMAFSLCKFFCCAIHSSHAACFVQVSATWTVQAEDG